MSSSSTVESVQKWAAEMLMNPNKPLYADSNLDAVMIVCAGILITRFIMFSVNIIFQTNHQSKFSEVLVFWSERKIPCEMSKNKYWKSCMCILETPSALSLRLLISMSLGVLPSYYWRWPARLWLIIYPNGLSVRLSGTRWQWLSASMTALLPN